MLAIITEGGTERRFVLPALGRSDRGSPLPGEAPPPAARALRTLRGKEPLDRRHQPAARGARGTGCASTTPESRLAATSGRSTRNSFTPIPRSLGETDQISTDPDGSDSTVAHAACRSRTTSTRPSKKCSSTRGWPSSSALPEPPPGRRIGAASTADASASCSGSEISEEPGFGASDIRAVIVARRYQPASRNWGPDGLRLVNIWVEREALGRAGHAPSGRGSIPSRCSRIDGTRKIMNKTAGHQREPQRASHVRAAARRESSERQLPAWRRRRLKSGSQSAS